MFKIQASYTTWYNVMVGYIPSICIECLNYFSLYGTIIDSIYVVHWKFSYLESKRLVNPLNDIQIEL